MATKLTLDQSMIIETLLGDIGLGVVVTDTAGTVLLFNSAATGILGVAAKQTAPADWPRRYGIYLADGVTLCPDVQSPLLRAIRGEEADNVEVFVLAPGALSPGRRCIINIRALRNRNGEIEGAVLLIQDISRRALFPLASLRQNCEGTGASLLAEEMMQQEFTEKTLQEAHERLSRAISISRIGLWDWNIGDGKVRWDRRMYQLFGVMEGQFIPSFATFIECVYPDDRKHVKDAVENAVLAAGEFDFAYRVIWTDATIHYQEAKGKVFCDRQGKSQRMTGLCIDVTEHKLAELALRDSEQRLHLALESAKMGVWDWDLINNTVWRSLKHDEIFGYESMLPKWTYEMFLNHVIPEDRATVQQNIDLALASGDFKMECRIMHIRDHCIRWISAQGEAHMDEQGKATRMMGTLTDITEVKQREQLLQASRKRREQISHEIVQHAPIGIVILDSELKVTDANKAFVTMMHCPLEKLVNQPLIAILPDQIQQTAKESIISGTHLQIDRLKVTIPDQQFDRQRYWNLSLWPVANDEGELTGAVLQTVDCTKTVLLEQERDDFVASIAHDIKTPLDGAQRIFDELCNKSQKTLAENQAHKLSVLRDSNRGLLSLVQNLVDVYRYETVAYSCNYESIDLRALVASCIEQITHFAESHDVAVHCAISHSLNFIQADALGIRRVLFNLLHNAVKFNKQQGAVEVTIEQFDQVVKLSIIDTGNGISSADQQKLFQRFAQGKTGTGFTSGTGLGLYLSKKIIEAHQGTIACESTVGFGTTFIVTLPISKPDWITDLVKE